LTIRGYELLQILEKFDFDLPRTFEQKINKNIKDVCKKAGIKEPQVINEVRCGVKWRIRCIRIG
jgi:hypothetical protein